MKVGLEGGGIASERDIVALEKLIGQPLDLGFRKFIAENDGAIPESNAFPVNGISNFGGVNEFTLVKEIIEERAYFETIGKHAYPVALSAGGNYVVLDQGRGGAIFFWDHELDAFSMIAGSFVEFLDMIEPFDESSIKLAPGQVISAWIDPDFLKQFSE
jgi:SMI1-KNR4 cell-wall